MSETRCECQKPQKKARAQPPKKQRPAPRPLYGYGTEVFRRQCEADR